MFTLPKRLSPCAHVPPNPPHARAQVELEAALEAEQEAVTNKLQARLVKLGAEREALGREKAELKRQVAELAGAVQKLGRDKVCARPSARA